MKAEKEIKFFAVVISAKDFNGFKEEYPRDVEAIYRADLNYRDYRKRIGKKVNNYLFVNQDEPYIDKIWKVILEGENAKLKPQKSDLPSSTQGR